jgi:chromosome segregation ATPase
MEKENKIKEILQAVSSKEFSQNQLEPSRKGKTISNMKQGKQVTENKVNEIHARLLNLRSGVETKETKEVVETKEVQEIKEVQETKEKELKNMQETISMLQSQIESLTKKVATLEVENIELAKKVSDLEVVRSANNTSNNIVMDSNNSSNNPNNELSLYGFKIQTRKTVTDSREYQKFYAIGYSKVIYIGSDITKAKDKIEKWVKSHKLEGKIKID